MTVVPPRAPKAMMALALLSAASLAAGCSENPKGTIKVSKSRKVYEPDDQRATPAAGPRAAVTPPTHAYPRGPISDAAERGSSWTAPFAAVVSRSSSC